MNFSNSVFRGIMKIGNIWWLNILWLVTSLPVITIGASTTALIYASMKLHDDDGYPTSNFFHSFQQNFKQATALWAIYGAVGALLAYALIFWNQMRVAGAHIFVMMIGIIYLLSSLYVFFVQAKFVHTVADTIRYSFRLAFRHWKETLMMAVVMIAVIYFNVTTNLAVNLFTICLGVGFIAYLFAVYYRKIFEIYAPKEDSENEDCPDQ